MATVVVVATSSERGCGSGGGKTYKWGSRV